MITCPVCGSARVVRRYSGLEKIWEVKIEIFRCESCGSGFAWPAVSFEEIEAKAYQPDYHAYKTAAADPEKERRKLSRVGRVLDDYFGYGRPSLLKPLRYPLFLKMVHYPKVKIKGKILDVGCGTAQLLKKLNHFGWETYGTDLSAHAIAAAKQNGVKHLFRGPLEAAKFPAQFFDAVSLNHVLEHAPKPAELLAEVGRILKPGGELIIAVPNFHSLASRIFGRYWAGLDLPRHVIFFSAKGLRELLERAGFSAGKIYRTNALRGLAASASVFLSRPKWEEKFVHAFYLGDVLFDLIGNPLCLGDQLVIRARKR